MNTLTKKTLIIGFALLSSACAHDSQHYVYYPSDTAYSSGYTIMHRNYYGERPEYYDHGYYRENSYFPHQHHHDQYSVRPSWGENHQGWRHHHDEDHDHSHNNDNNRLQYGNPHQHNDDDD